MILVIGLFGGLVRTVRAEDIAPCGLKVIERSFFDRCSHLPEKVLVKIKIMDRIQPHREDFP